MTTVCVVAALPDRTEVVHLLERAGLDVAGEGRTAADGERLERHCRALVVLGDAALVTDLLQKVRVPVVVLVTAENPETPPGASLLIPWPTSDEGLQAMAEQILAVTDRNAPLAPVPSRTATPPAAHAPAPVPAGGADAPRPPRLVVIGASAGGPPALVELLRQLRPLPVPVLIVQHQHPAFADALRVWLGRLASMPVVTAADGMALTGGTVVLGQPGLDMVVDHDRRCRLRPGKAGLAPSIDVCMRSVARIHGAAAVGIILTGMGHDGAEGLRAMRDRGATTIAQDRASSAVFGMPAAAVQAGGAQHVLPLQDMAAALHQAFGIDDGTRRRRR
jgi:chemotaxis response regulator CheB